MGITTASTSTKKFHSGTKLKIFHIGSVAPLKKSQGAKNFFRAVEMMCELGFSVAVLSAGDEKIQEHYFVLLERYPERFEVLEDVQRNRQKILDESDLIVFSSNPDSRTLAEVIQKNVVPVLPEGNGLLNFDPQREVGTAFTFEPENFWSFVAAIIRAHENFKFLYDWKVLKKNLEEVVL